MKNYMLVACLLGTTTIAAQSFSKYEWKNRLMIIVDKTEQQENLQAQLLLLQAKEEELKDRKLKIYQYSEKQVKMGLDESNDWKEGALPVFLKQRMRSTATFSVFLIGLDGGLKKQWIELVPLQEIFDLIDSMPMRRAEMERKWNNSFK